MRPQRHEQMATGRVLLEKAWYDADEMDKWLADDTVERHCICEYRDEPADLVKILPDDEGFEEVCEMGDTRFVLYEDHCRARAADRERIAELERELAEYESLFELQSKRLDEATAAWRAAHPGHDDMLPDLGRLLEWLMSERTEARTERDTAVAACRERDEEIARLRELLMDAIPCSSLTGETRKEWCRNVNEACDAHRAALGQTTKEDDDEHTRQD